MTNRTKIIAAALIIALAAAARLAPHPFNFTPIAGMALFSGCYLKKRWAAVFPLGAMFLSDYFIGFYEWQVMLSVYLSFAAVFALGWFLRGRVKWQNVILASLASSVGFFLVTNFAVWAFFDWYPHTWQGLITNYTLALPFFRNTLAGDLFYSGMFFGAYEFLTAYLLKRQVSVQRA